MTYATINAITDNVVVRLSQVPGTAVQTYAEPTIKQALRSHFRIVARQDWWHHLMYWQNFAVSATTGISTTDFSGLAQPVTEIGNVQFIYDVAKRPPISRVNPRMNPALLTGTNARFYEPQANQTTLFRILPVTTTSAMTMRYRYIPSLAADTDEVPFDEEYMLLAGVYDYLEDDGGNPGQTEKFRHLLNMRLEQLNDSQNDGDVPLRGDGRGTEIPTTWEQMY